MSYAIQQYFLNGGNMAVVVRLNKRLGEEDGGVIGFTEIADPSLKEKQCGLWAFDQTNLLNLLCIPPFGWQEDVDSPTWKAALDYCKARRAFLVVDSPSVWKNTGDASRGIDAMGIRDGNGAIYFPRLRVADPPKSNQLKDFAPCGAVAGVIARTDATRGVWKAPAGSFATLTHVPDFSYHLTDADNGILDRLGINCLRKMHAGGCMIWGARTLLGDDLSTSEWKYVPVRRLALFLEESIDRGLKWVVFEPNGEPLWQQIRLNVNAFMHGLFRQGAFQGSKPNDAYFVKCDRDTTTHHDIDQGIVNILVGFAPLRPAEFIVLSITQRAADPQI
jgi:phage tail sheath protein FI